MKKQVKNRNIYQILSSMLMFIVMLTLTLCHNFAFLNNYAIAQAENENQEVDTNFMYSPASAVIYNDVTLVLDTKQNSIVKIKDNKILQGENSVTSAYGANHMYSIGSYVLLLSTNANTSSEIVRILNAETFEEVIIAQSLDNTLTHTYDKVSSYTHENTLYLLLYSLDAGNGIDQMLYFSVSLENDTFTISNPRELSINTNLVGNNFKSNIKSLNLVYNREQNYMSCLVHSNSEIFGFEIKSSNEISSLNGSDISLSSLENVTNIYIKSYGNLPYIIFEKQSKIVIDELLLPNELNDNFRLSNDSTTFDTTFNSISNISVTNNRLVICSETDQKVLVSVISSENNKIVLNSLNYSVNPSIKTILTDNSEIILSEIIDDSSVNLTSEPYTNKGLITLPPETKVVRIGYGEIYYGEYDSSSAQKLNGYDYYLATVNGKNYYGYLPISSVTSLYMEESIVPYAFTKKNVNIYKYPSNTIDDNNKILHTLTEVTKVELVNDISEFNYSVGTNNATRSFYEVRYNDQIGYIVSTDMDTFPEVVLVQTNASITRTVSVYENLTDKLPTWTLSEGARVRILENRFGNEKYTKISFNDDDGVTCTGYILADSVQADSWSTLQIIGFVLVLFSIVLLIILLIVRNRINHE